MTTLLPRSQPEIGCLSAEDREALDAIYIQHLKSQVGKLTDALERAREYVRPRHGGDIQADADMRMIDEALAMPLEQRGCK